MAKDTDKKNERTCCCLGRCRYRSVVLGTRRNHLLGSSLFEGESDGVALEQGSDASNSPPIMQPWPTSMQKPRGNGRNEKRNPLPMAKRLQAMRALRVPDGPAPLGRTGHRTHQTRLGGIRISSDEATPPSRRGSTCSREGDPPAAVRPLLALKSTPLLQSGEERFPSPGASTLNQFLSSPLRLINPQSNLLKILGADLSRQVGGNADWLSEMHGRG